MKEIMEIQKLMEYEAEINRRNRENKLKTFNPYPKQREFINDKHKIVALFGGNQSGKTTVGSAFCAYHLTGYYPDWYEGVRYDKPVIVWVAGESSTRVRDTLQEKLFGPLGEWGTGLIPKECIVGDPVRKSGIPGAIDICRIKHKSGANSTIQFFSYDQGREKFQGSTVNFVWCDEEPPEDIFKEAKMRTIAVSGYVFLTFTPLRGVTPLCDEMINNKDGIYGVHYLTWDDVTHLSEDDKRIQLAGLGPHEIESRKFGKPTVGTGKVYQFDEEEYVVPDFEINPNWKIIGGLDVGIAHPTCAVVMAIDPQSNTGYIYQEYKKSGETSIYHAYRLRDWECKFSIDPNSRQRSIATGDSPFKLYQDILGEEKLIIADNRVNYGISFIRSKIAAEQLYIFESCIETLKEMRLYRFKPNGDILKQEDDLMDAFRYCVTSWDKVHHRNHIIEKHLVNYEWKPINKRIGY
jgi:phage terminase large subunit-like protein